MKPMRRSVVPMSIATVSDRSPSETIAAC